MANEGIKKIVDRATSARFKLAIIGVLLLILGITIGLLMATPALRACNEDFYTMAYLAENCSNDFNIVLTSAHQCAEDVVTCYSQLRECQSQSSLGG